MPLPQQTLIGNLTADPELRFTPNGKAVVNFTVACSERRLNKMTDEWEDGDSMFVRCNAWEGLAENIAECAHKGVSVIVTGAMYQRSYETSEGEKRFSIDCRVRNFALQVSQSQTASAKKVSRSGSYDGGQGSAPPVGDPWAADERTPAGASSFADEPPFARALMAWERPSLDVVIC